MLDILSLCIIATYIYYIVFIILGLFKHQVLPISSSRELPIVSVVIAARNEEKHLPDILRDLVKQEYPIEKLEVIIVNDRSSDSTKEILEEASKSYIFIKGDICNSNLIRKVLNEYSPRYIVNFAAESHVIFSLKL